MELERTAGDHASPPDASRDGAPGAAWSWLVAVLASAWLGSFAATGLTALHASAIGAGPPDSGVLMGVFVLLFATIAVFPLATIGLVLLGLPFMRLLRDFTQCWWLALLVPIAGGIAGRIAFYFVDRVLLFASDDFSNLFHVGALTGAATGLFWYYFAVRAARPPAVRAAC